ncbi:MAG: CinA family nicotinamide mononucleotide deamidase-related protein [Bacteriovoracia bacterium]
MAKKSGKEVLLLSIGDELLDGRTQNTNASWIGEQFRLNGIKVTEVRCVSDDLSEIVEALHTGKKFSVVIATGGLGPTNDDRTLLGAAKAFKKALVKTKASLEHVRSRYAARNVELTETRQRLALVPKGAKILQNPTGTAPGVHLKIEKTDFFFLPGPPHECRPMFEADILPKAKKKLSANKLVRREFWRTFGRGEGDIYASVKPIVETLEQKYPEAIRFGVHISFPYIDLTLEHWKAPGKKNPAPAELDAAVKAVLRALGMLCFTRERETLPEVLVKMLQYLKCTVATAESCTGGLAGKLLTDIPGTSSVYLGGVIAYANEVKVSLLGVRPEILETVGAVSEPCAFQMAEGARLRFGSTFALALTGISGPGGATPTKPVGTLYVALSDAEGSQTMHHVILSSKGNREQNRIIAAHLAFDALRRRILNATKST